MSKPRTPRKPPTQAKADTKQVAATQPQPPVRPPVPPDHQIQARRVLVAIITELMQNTPPIAAEGYRERVNACLNVLCPAPIDDGNQDPT